MTSPAQSHGPLSPGYASTPNDLGRQLDFDIRAMKHPAFTADIFGVVAYVNEAFLNFLVCIDEGLIQEWESSDRPQDSSATVQLETRVRERTLEGYKHNDALSRANAGHENTSEATIPARGQLGLVGKQLVEIMLDYFDPGEGLNVHPGRTAGAWLCNLYSATLLNEYLFGISAVEKGVRPCLEARLLGGCPLATDPSLPLKGVRVGEVRAALRDASAEDASAETGELRENVPDNNLARAIGRWLRYCSTGCNRGSMCREVLLGTGAWQGLLPQRDERRRTQASVEWAFVRMEGMAIPGRKYLDLRQQTVFSLMLDSFATFKSQLAMGCQGMFQLATARKELLDNRLREQHGRVSRLALYYLRHEINTPHLILQWTLDEWRRCMPRAISEGASRITVYDRELRPSSVLAREYPDMVYRELEALANNFSALLRRVNPLMEVQIEHYTRASVRELTEEIINYGKQTDIDVVCKELPDVWIRTQERAGCVELTQLQILFENLIDNAGEAHKGARIEGATQEPRCRVVIGVETIDTPSGQFVLFRLSDNGPGFDGTMLGSTLGVSSVTKTKNGEERHAHGFGLYISNEVAQKHRNSSGEAGRVEINNNDPRDREKGALVTVRLPAAEPSDRRAPL